MIEIERPKIDTATLSADGRYGKFVVEPLERGFGTTLGNSLRRVLLSSLPGVAITSVKIDGVVHEFSTVEGVKEDVTEIVLNLKGVRLWILLEAPVPVGTIFSAKLLAGLTLSLPAVAIGVPLGAIGCGQGPLEVFALTLLGFAAGCFTVLEGLVLNLLWPKLDAVNDTVIVKNSMSVTVQVFGSFGLLAAGAGLFILLQKFLSAAGVLLCISGLLIVCCVVFLLLLRGWGKRAFSRLCS